MVWPWVEVVAVVRSLDAVGKVDAVHNGCHVMAQAGSAIFHNHRLRITQRQQLPAFLDLKPFAALQFVIAQQCITNHFERLAVRTLRIVVNAVITVDGLAGQFPRPLVAKIPREVRHIGSSPATGWLVAQFVNRLESAVRIFADSFKQYVNLESRGTADELEFRWGFRCIESARVVGHIAAGQVRPLAQIFNAHLVVEPQHDTQPKQVAQAGQFFSGVGEIPFHGRAHVLHGGQVSVDFPSRLIHRHQAFFQQFLRLFFCGEVEAFRLLQQIQFIGQAQVVASVQFLARPLPPTIFDLEPPEFSRFIELKSGLVRDAFWELLIEARVAEL